MNNTIEELQKHNYEKGYDEGYDKGRLSFLGEVLRILAYKDAHNTFDSVTVTSIQELVNNELKNIKL